MTAAHETVLEATGARGRLARVYAEALLSTATQANEADAVGEQLDSFAADLLGRHPAIASYLANPAVNREQKVSALREAINNPRSNTTILFRKFLGVLHANNRLGLLSDIAVAYRKLRDQAARRVRVTVRAATDLTPDQTAALTATLAESLNQTPILTVVVEPELLGGLIVQVGDRVYDTSVRSRLETLRTHLMTSVPHVVQTQRQ
jgi:F-type H+-transporting ATPase subunit delta